MPRAPAFDLDTTLSALADPVRRAILSRLAKGEARVTDVAEPFEISLNSVSKHIRRLEAAGLVRRRKSGREFLLALQAEPLDRVELWLTQTRALWNYRLNRLDSLLSAEDAASKSVGAVSRAAAKRRSK
jgi:DNA-binding transcriptional ArsR family regulator